MAKTWIRAAAVKQRYGDISEQTLWRWVRNSGFPKPVKILGVRYWDVAALDRYDTSLLDQAAA